MYELKKIGKVFTSTSVGTGPSSYKKGIYRAAVSQRLRNTRLRTYSEGRHAKHSFTNDVFLAYASGERETPDITSVLGRNS